MSETLIKVEGVSKKFCRSLKKSLWYGMQDLGSEMLGKRHGGKDELRPDEFWAVKDVSFELKRGECLGLIGRNGAGKTTLLKVLNGLIKPDQGRVEMRGNIGALIALGAGFNPILSGRENLYINASILGLTKNEIESKYEEIVDFAGLGEFMEMPVQNYSSGMQVRLGFAVATTFNPDVLILDEILAVGDAQFRAKCYNRIGKLQRNTAIIFVSHSMQQVAQICTSVLTMNRGQVSWLGEVRGGVAVYEADNISDQSDSEKTLIMEPPLESASLEFVPDKIGYGESVTVKFRFQLSEPMPACTVRIPMYSAEGLVIAEWNSKILGLKIDLESGFNTGEIELGPLNLARGVYQFGFVLNDATGVFLPYWSLKYHCIEIAGYGAGAATYVLPNTQLSLRSDRIV